MPRLATKIRRANGPRRVRSRATPITHTPTHPHTHTPTHPKECFTVYPFRKKGAALRGHLGCKYPVRSPLDLRSFPFLRSKKSVMFLDGFWHPKCLQNPSKMTPKTSKKALKNWCFFASSFSYDFLSNVPCFRSRPTHDFTAIYNTFVGCTIFRAVKKVPKISFKTTPTIHAKSLQKSFKKRCSKKKRKNTRN